MNMRLLALFLYLSMLSIPCLSNPFKAAIESGRIEEVKAVIAAGHDLNFPFHLRHGHFIGPPLTMLDAALRSYAEEHPFIAALRGIGAVTEMERDRRLTLQYIEQLNQHEREYGIGDSAESEDDDSSSVLSYQDADQEDESSSVLSLDSEEVFPSLFPILFNIGSMIQPQ
jgi:hypothetical protein